MDVDDRADYDGALDGGEIETGDEGIEEMISGSEGEGNVESDEGKMDDRSEGEDSDIDDFAMAIEPEEYRSVRDGSYNAQEKGKGKGKTQEVDSDAASEGWRAARGGGRQATVSL
jgi:hypothetical protein